MRQISGALIVGGSIAFIVAAFMPITFAFIVQRNIEAVRSRPIEWAASQVLFGLGGAVTAAGLALLTLELRRGEQGDVLGYFACAAITVGAICWGAIVYARYTLPLERVLAEPTLGKWFVMYTLLTQAALLAYGLVLVRAGYPRWLGFGTSGLATASLVGYFVFKDVPPFIHYVITLIIGLALLL